MAIFDAVMWDFGGVFSPSPFTTIETIGREKGHDPQRFFHAIFGPYDGDTDHPWHRLERGEIDFMAARESIMELAKADGMAADPLELFTRMGQEGGGMREDVVALARQIKARGFQTAIVTNNAKEFRESWTKSVPIGDICHEIIDSSEIGIRKPDLRIFKIALKRLGVADPGRALFVDDFAANVEAAEALGIRGVLMEDDYRAALAKIERLTR
ncbi:MAG: HAD family phosphatase [bacterium]|nr:HAD family phosphatase [bacterium]